MLYGTRCDRTVGCCRAENVCGVSGWLGPHAGDGARMVTLIERSLRAARSLNNVNGKVCLCVHTAYEIEKRRVHRGW